MSRTRAATSNKIKALSAVALMLAALSVPSTSAAPVAFAGFNRYADAHEYRINGAATTYQGQQVSRIDNNPGFGSRLDNQNACTVPLAATFPVYQTMWNILGVNYPYDWIEAGTGHAASGGSCKFNYRFWGWGTRSSATSATFYLTGWHKIGTSGTLRVHKLYKNGSNDWLYYVDGAFQGVARANWNANAVRLTAGYETYDSSVFSGKHNYGGLKYLKSGVWSNWAGRDLTRVESGWGVCGKWSTSGGTAGDTNFFVAQNRPC